MSEEYLRYRILENRVRDDSPNFIRWLNEVHSISIEEMITFFEEDNWDVRFGRDRGLTVDKINKLMKDTKKYWKTAEF